MDDQHNIETPTRLRAPQPKEAIFSEDYPTINTFSMGPIVSLFYHIYIKKKQKVGRYSKYFQIFV